MKSILIVDDQELVQEFLSEELTNEGYGVSSVGDIESAWRHLRDSRPDLVLLDIYLDGFEGWKLLSDIKKEDSNLPVLVVTAYDSFEGDPRLSKADGYVVKNFIDLDKTMKKIADILSRKTVSHVDKNRYLVQPDRQNLLHSDDR